VTNNGNGGTFLHILSFIEQDNLYKANSVADGRNGNLPTYSEWGPTIGNVIVKTYICPSDYTQRDGNRSRASYGVNGQVFRHNYNWGGIGLLRFPGSIPDGTSNTIMYTEKLAECNSGAYTDNFWPDWGPILSSSDEGDPTGPTAPGPQIKPPMLNSTQANCNGGVASTGHTAVIMAGIFDGSVRTVSGGISTTTWWFAMTPAGGETLGSDW
jgi:hypothetical protein